MGKAWKPPLCQGDQSRGPRATSMLSAGNRLPQGSSSCRPPSFRPVPRPALRAPHPGWQSRLRSRVLPHQKVILGSLFRRLRRGSSCRCAAELGWWPWRRQPGSGWGRVGGRVSLSLTKLLRDEGYGASRAFHVQHFFPWRCRWPLCCPQICG